MKQLKKKIGALKQEGITLVALVVTIVVLLILAGITINMLFSDNGIIKQAQKAENKTNEANKKEKEELENAEDVLNHYSNGIINGGGNTPGPNPSDGSYSEEKKVNTPKLGEGMTPIKWDTTAKDGAGDWIETTGNDKDWYSYTETDKKWANAKTEDGSMWVWIPRYSYQIETNWHTNSTTGGTINIKFLKGTTNTASDGTTSWDNSSGQGNWNVHPAFSYGSEVSGIWVAKFEASRVDATSSSAGSSNTIKVQPGVQSWRSITIDNTYINCLNYNSTLNSHQMKNSEWGAATYLAQSVYGKNSEVWINNSSSYITGSAGNSAVAGADVGTTNDYKSIQGVNASTTGNIYGIYDMSGGAWEYTVAYVNNGHGNLTTYGTSLVSGNAKTKDVYTSATSSGADTQQADYETTKSKYGDAIYETSLTYNSSNDSWYRDCADFPCLDSPFFIRGGGYGSVSDAGTLCFGRRNGIVYGDVRFPPSVHHTLKRLQNTSNINNSNIKQIDIIFARLK